MSSYATNRGSGVTKYANFAAFPALAANGTLAIALDTASLYIYNAGLPGWVMFEVATTAVNGPGSSTDQALAAWSGTTGTQLENTSVKVDVTNGGLLVPVNGYIGVNGNDQIAFGPGATTFYFGGQGVGGFDGGGIRVYSGHSLELAGGGHTLSITGGSMGADYTVTMPTAQGAAGAALTNDGSGTLSWTVPSASGANTTLSNLTSPTAINQNLLFGTDDTKNIGAAAASRPSYIYATQQIRVGPAPLFEPSALGNCVTATASDSSISALLWGANGFGGGAIGFISPDQNFYGLTSRGANIAAHTLQLYMAGANTQIFKPNGDLYWGTDKTGDLGAATDHRPANIFAGTYGQIGDPSAQLLSGWGSGAAETLFIAKASSDGYLLAVENRDTTSFVYDGVAGFYRHTAAHGDGMGITFVMLSDGGGYTAEGLYFGMVKVNDTNYDCVIAPQYNGNIVDAAGEETVRVKANGSLTMMRSTTADLFWNTDQAGSIGASGANRPKDLFLARDATIGGATADGYQRTASATNGGSTTISDHVSVLILHTAAGIATYTVTMPANPLDGQLVSIGVNNAITALTVSPNSGQSITGGSLATFIGGQTWIYVATDTNWYPL